MQRVQVLLTDEQLSGIRQRSAETGEPVASIVRRAVSALLADDERMRQVERALAAIGGFHSGLGDLAERHDDYLAEDLA